MQPVKLMVIGAGGYGHACLEVLFNNVARERYHLVAAADPGIESVPLYTQLQERGVQLFTDARTMLEQVEADAVFIASPIQYHEEQCRMALERGCAVLCEKPLTPRVEEAIGLRDLAAAKGLPLGVGFQWSYAEPILAAKRDVLAGRYGKPQLLKCIIQWQRDDAYYDPRGWKGRIHDASGALIRDSVVTNATAHYLHNLFFMLGEELGASQMPSRVDGSVYRAKPIESFDSCFLSGDFPGGGRFLYLSTHCSDENSEPMFDYIFENGHIHFDSNVDYSVTGHVNGETISYGALDGHSVIAAKLNALLDAVQSGTPMTCPVDAVLPQLRVCESLFEPLDCGSFPADRIVRGDNPPSWYVQGLTAELERCYSQGQTPWEAGLPWAKPDTRLKLD